MDNLIGGNFEDLNAAQTCLRALIIFIAALLCIRIAGMRSFANNSPLDVVVNIIVGSVLARAIGGHVPFWASIAAAFSLSLIHRILAVASTRSDKVSHFFKGKPRLLVKDGDMIRKNMRFCSITEGDLMEGIRQGANVNSLDEVKEAFFERNGRISVIPKEKKQ